MGCFPQVTGASGYSNWSDSSLSNENYEMLGSLVVRWHSFGENAPHLGTTTLFGVGGLRAKRARQFWGWGVVSEASKKMWGVTGVRAERARQFGVWGRASEANKKIWLLIIEAIDIFAPYYWSNKQYGPQTASMLTNIELAIYIVYIALNQPIENMASLTEPIACPIPPPPYGPPLGCRSGVFSWQYYRCRTFLREVIYLSHTNLTTSGKVEVDIAIGAVIL